MASEDGIDQAELTKSLDGFTPTLNGFLMKLFVEKSDRPTIEMLQQDEWLSKNESKQGVFNNVYYRECRYDWYLRLPLVEFLLKSSDVSLKFEHIIYALNKES